MFKTLVMLKRHPSLTREQFIDYYENHHVKLAEPHLKSSASRYVRRYLQSASNPLTGEVVEPEFDVITEMWYPTREVFEAARGTLKASPDVIEAIAKDEETLFDRSRNRFYFVEERESDLSPDRSEAGEDGA